jgi:hypothetical protein
MLEASLFPRKLASHFFFTFVGITFFVGSGLKSGSGTGTGMNYGSGSAKAKSCGPGSGSSSTTP